MKTDLFFKKSNKNGDNLEIRFYVLGTKEWLANGKLHRDHDQPAIVRRNGEKYWYKNGKLHRENDQSAVVYYNGTKEWWVNGVRILK